MLRRPVAVALGLALLACGGRKERPRYIVVVPDAEVVDAAPPPPKAGPWVPGQARATVLDAMAAGTSAARPGDIRLENDRLVCVVAAADHPARGQPTGGHLVDLFARGAHDQLGEAAITLDPDGRRQPVIDSVVVAQHGAGGGPAIVRATGHHPLDEQVEVTLDYVLEPDANHVRLVATVYNKSRGHFPKFTFGAFVLWGGLAPFVPGPAAALEGSQTWSDWIGGDSMTGSVVIATYAGRLSGVHGRDWSLVQLKSNPVGPGASAVAELHLFAVGDGGVAAAVAELHRSRRTVVGTIRGKVTDKDGRPIAGAWVHAVTSRGDVLARALTDPAGGFLATLRAGTYRVIAQATGRAASPSTRIVLGADAVAETHLRMGPPSRLAFAIDGPDGRALPARLRITGLDGTPTPVLGPPGGLPAARNEVIAPEGRGQQPLAPGAYQIAVTAGPEFEALTQRVTVTEGREVPLRATLARALDRRGWFALDPHVLTDASPTASASVAARDAACAAEGIDGAVMLDVARATEPIHGRVRLFTGVSHSLQGVGRFAALPLRAGILAPTEPGRLAADHLGALAKLPGEPLVAVLRPRTSGWGYFRHFRFDPTVRELPRGGFSLDFDLLEVASPGEQEATDAALQDYLGLLERGHPVVPIGGSGAAAVAGQPCGLPRTWVRGGNLTTDEALVTALRAANVVVSFGPLVDLEVDGLRPGPPTAAGPAPKATVRVQAASWARPDVLRLYVNGRVARQARVAGSGPLDVTRTFPLPAGARNVVAVVEGERDLSPVIGRRARPLAFTSAVRLRPAR